MEFSGVVALLGVAVAAGALITRAARRGAHIEASMRDFRAALEHSGDVVTLLDADWKPRFVSPAVHRVLGYQPREFLDAGAGLDAPRDAGRIAEQLADVQRRGSGSTARLRARLRHRDGSWREVELTLANRLDDPAARALVVACRDISELRSLQQQVEQGSMRDPVTGVATRALFLDRVGHALDVRLRRGGTDAILVINIAGADDLAAQLGPPGIDALLAAVAERLTTCLRAGDTAARIDEMSFAVLLEAAGEQVDVVDAAERLVEVLALPLAVHPPGKSSVDLAVSAHIGVATTDGAGTPAALLADAELAAAELEASGDAGVRVFDRAAQQRVAERVALREELSGVLARGELFLRYEPIIDLDSLRTVAVEAQATWSHPLRGPMSAAELLALAEQCDMAATIGRWMLHEACTQARQWIVAGAPPVTLHVDVCAAQVRDPALLDDVAAALAASGLSPQQLCLELPERVLMTDLPAAVHLLDGLAAVQVRAAIDGFGSGYCSLTTLRQLPIDLLKIDESIVSALATSSHHAAVARSVVTLATGVGIAVGVAAIAIRDITQLTDLQGLGCRYGQGRYFTEPLVASEVAGWLAREQRRRTSAAE